MRDDVRLASANAPLESNEQYAKVARPEPNLILRTPVSTAHPNSVVAASYNPPVNQTTSPVSVAAIPQPAGAWNNIAPASYNEISPAANAPASYSVISPAVEESDAYNEISPAPVEQPQPPRAKLNWLPGDTIPLNIDALNTNR